MKFHVGVTDNKWFAFLAVPSAARNGPRYGSICNTEELDRNLKANDIPEEIHEMDAADYGRFLELRCAMMAARMRECYEGL